MQQKTGPKTGIVKLFSFFVVVSVVNIIVLSSLYFLFPDLRDFLFAEDKLVEDLTALFYLLSFILGLFLFFSARESRLSRVYLALPVIGLLGFFEEMSYGERILKFKPHLVYNEYFDALHDLIPIAVNYLQLHANFLLFALPLTGFILIGAAIMKYRRSLSLITHFIGNHPPAGFFLIAAGMLLFAQVHDLNLVKPDFTKLFEELFEMNGSCALFFAVLSMRYVATQESLTKKKPDQLEKKLPFSFLTIFSFFLFLAAGSYFFYYATTESLARESQAYVDVVVPRIFSSWDPEALLEELVPELHPGEAQNRNIRMSFDLQSKRFGSMETYTFKGNEAVEKYKKLEYFERGDKIYVFTNFAEAVFEKSPAGLRVVTIKREGKWSILGLKIDPIR